MTAKKMIEVLEMCKQNSWDGCKKCVYKGDCIGENDENILLKDVTECIGLQKAEIKRLQAELTKIKRLGKQLCFDLTRGAKNDR